MYILGFVLTLFLSLFSDKEIHPTTQEGTLVLFTQKADAVITDIETEAIREVAEESGVSFLVHDVSDGLPANVSTTPSIYYINDSGNSKYYGRYSNTKRIRNFIRTSKMAHQKDAENIKDKLLVWTDKKAEIAAPIKITEPAGHPPKDINNQAFINQTQAAIAEGMTDFKWVSNFNINKNTRSFYFNIYPYVSEDKKLYITTEIYSQFNCVKPTFQQFEPSFVQGNWKDRHELFREAGKKIEAEIKRQIQSSNQGDAFRPVPENVKSIAWTDIVPNLAANDAGLSADKINPDLPFGKKWKVKARKQAEDPILIFSFLPPLDHYAGEVTSLSGNMELDENNSMQKATGKFKVKISDVTMGSEDFDYEVQNKMLKMGMFPDAYFEFTGAASDTRPLVAGQVETLVMNGKFTMMNIETPIKVDTRLTPIPGDKSVKKIQVNASFRLPLFEVFKVYGPDGPSPAKDELQFYLKFILESKE